MPPGVFCNSIKICLKPTQPLAPNSFPVDRLMPPTLKVAGSNPVGRTKNRRKCIAFGGFSLKKVRHFRWSNRSQRLTFQKLFNRWEPPRLRHTLVQHGSAVPANDVL